MFQPPLFQETRAEVMQALIATHPFATLVTHLDGCLTADHLPMVRAGEELHGHVALANPLAQAEGPFDGLAVFQGPQTYITPAYYPSKQEHGKVVPTWNYAVVHVAGAVRIERDEAWLTAHLRALTDAQESQRPQPWAVSDAPEDFMARQMRGIVGIALKIVRMDGKWKVSQNKNEADKRGVVTGLAAEPSMDAQAVGRLVSER